MSAAGDALRVVKITRYGKEVDYKITPKLQANLDRMKREALQRYETLPWKNDAVEMYQSGIGLKTICRKHSLNPNTLRRVLMALGVYKGKKAEDWKSRCGASGRLQQQRRLKGVSATDPRTVRRLQKQTHRFEQWRFSFGDESTHWLSHPECKRWSANKSALRTHYRRYKIDAAYTVSRSVRLRIYSYIRKGHKSKRTESLLGCSWEQFAKHIENQFELGMSWKNYGTYWHIDHIKPCSSFDLTKVSEQMKCFHYSNQRPLTAQENMSKSDRLPDGTRARVWKFNRQRNAISCKSLNISPLYESCHTQ